MIFYRTNAYNKDFQQLAAALEQELSIRDGDAYLALAALNSVEWLQYVVLAYKNGQVMGAGALRAISEGAMEIKRMYVLSEKRRQGIAGSILKELENWGRELGYTICMLETGKNQPEAIALYDKHQYMPIPNFGRYAGNENSICFEKKLL
jgi:GNAT superfamily N-acetyltransferase